MLSAGVFLVLSAAPVVAAPVPKSLKKAPTVNGHWEAITLRSSGNDFTRGSPWVWEIEGDTVTRHYKQPDGTLRHDGPASLTRPDPKNPAEVDYLLPSGNQSILFRARIAIEDDELIINFAEADAARPPDMTELQQGYYYRFRRMAK